ncbi:MAG: hypothetical protein V4440_03565 [Pseudomonadota bacterium]
MSRIRTVKPELWTSEQIASCSRDARLLFIGMWSFCDDAGVHPASYMRLKMEILPADDCSTDEIKKWVNELIANDLLREYAIDDQFYWIVTGWSKHQRIDRPTYKFPKPLSGFKKISDNSAAIPRGLTDNSTSPFRDLDDYSASSQGVIDEPSTTEWKGMEGNGKEKDLCEVKTSQRVVSAGHSSADINEIFTYWQQVMKHPCAKLDSKRKTKIANALKLGYSNEELKQAIDGCALTPYNMGANERSEKYDDIELILRDASHIDRFITNATNTANRALPDHVTSDTLAGVL